MNQMLHDIVFNDDSDSDEDIEERRRPRWMREREEHFDNLDDVDFATRFRLSKQSAILLLDHIEHRLEFPAEEKNNSISPINQLLTTLRYYATGCTQLTAGDFSGFSKSTANRIVHRVSAAIASLRPNYVVFPETQDEIRATQLGFYNIARFPRAVGALDCTHVKISSPGGANAELYRNRKGYFSVNVQAICNSNLEFTDIVARWAGSVHDSTIFRNSYRRGRFEQGTYGDSVILGDAGYACSSYVIPPMLQPASRAEHLFNESQIRSRNPIERLFGVWKRRFPVLALGMRLKLENVYPIIVATAVLHNILKKWEDPLPPDDQNLNLPAPWAVMLENGDMREALEPQNQHAELQNPQYRVRRQLIDNYFASL